MVLLAVIPYIACFILYRFFFFFKAVDLFSSLLLFSLSLSLSKDELKTRTRICLSKIKLG